MRRLFILTFVANVAVTLVSLVVLPSRVAIHYGADGMANGWGPNSVNVLLMMGTHILLFCGLYFSPRLILLFPARYINLPNKDYWLSLEHRVLATEKIRDFMWNFGVGIFAFLLVLGVLSLQANLVTPARLEPRIFIPALGVFLLYTVGWTVAFYRAFRVPGKKA